MKEVNIQKQSDGLLIELIGRIDSNNAPQVEESMKEAFDSPDEVVIDAQNLEYISSAGLRVLLHLRKTKKNLRIINVSSEVYEIFDMTGFNQMMTVEKAYKVVSVEGCEVIGKGANGILYRIDSDNVVKVYKNADALNDIQHEREVARLALVLGIPTAISYDVVKVGDSYGSVFELLNATSFSKILATEPDKFDWCVNEFAGLLKKIHETEVPEGKLPSIKETALKWAEFDKDYLPVESYEKLKSLIEKVPESNHMIHGDYHTNNIELQDGEVLLIDMDTLAVGHPIFELASIYNAFIGFYEVNKEGCKDFLKISSDEAIKFFNKAMSVYLGTEDEDRIKEVVDKARIVGYTRIIRRNIRRGALENETGKQEIELWTKELIELLDRIDTLEF
ncbi:anti-sigma factor antagonist [Butyrivibrio sp. FC2001]|uniref:anti-sigma factor antagonist n=1 Tax=Butyrivibrio sp. FC2001 TaxID=1280671 RepID=UPI0003FE0803|nr:anti-sigma factor antagonist [Butyrivibrio sp. FC2001]